VIAPKVGDVMFESGSANCGWLNALKNSARNSIPGLSRGQLTKRIFENSNIKIGFAGTVNYSRTAVAENCAEAICPDHRGSCEARLIEVVVELRLDRSSVTPLIAPMTAV
jgi:hypothetical protein